MSNEQQPSSGEQKRETSKSASKAVKLRRQSTKLLKAAAGAGDPNERQKLLNEALQKEFEAETFGKVAKWLSSGAFQGFLSGSTVGFTLGGIVTAIVGLITGGVGAGIGAIQGPIWKFGDIAGEGIRTITGDLPGWKATEEQKSSLEGMINSVRNEEPANDDELEKMASGEVGIGWREAQERSRRMNNPGAEEKKKTWTEYASSFMPSMPSMGSQANDGGEEKEEASSKPTGGPKQGQQGGGATRRARTQNSAQERGTGEAANDSQKQMPRRPETTRGPSRQPEQKQSPQRQPQQRPQRPSNESRAQSVQPSTPNENSTAPKPRQSANTAARRSQPSYSSKDETSSVTASSQAETVSTPNPRRQPANTAVRRSQTQSQSQPASQARRPSQPSQPISTESGTPTSKDEGGRKPRKLPARSKDTDDRKGSNESKEEASTTAKQPAQVRKKPQASKEQEQAASPSDKKPEQVKKKPRKLQVRSEQVNGTS